MCNTGVSGPCESSTLSLFRLFCLFLLSGSLNVSNSRTEIDYPWKNIGIQGQQIISWNLYNMPKFFQQTDIEKTLRSAGAVLQAPSLLIKKESH